MCAGSAQVTLVELRKSCYPGCNPSERQTKQNKEQPPSNQQPETTTPKRTPDQGNNLLRNSWGLAEKVSEGETGAMNSAKHSVYLVLQQTRKCLRHLVLVAGGITKRPAAGKGEEKCVLESLAKALDRHQCVA